MKLIPIFLILFFAISSCKKDDIKSDPEKDESLSAATVFLCGDTGLCQAFNSKTGKIKWEVNLGDFSVWSTPTYDHGLIFIGASIYSKNGKLLAFDAENGTKKWEVNTASPIFSTPLVYDNKIYFGTSDGSAHCINSVNGQKVWETSVAELHWSHWDSSPTLGNNSICYITRENIYFFNPETGAEKQFNLQYYRNKKQAFRHKPQAISRNVFSSPSFANNHLYFTYESVLEGWPHHTLLDYNLTTSKISSETTLSYSNEMSSPTVNNDVVLVGDNINLHAFQTGTFDKKWQFNFQENTTDTTYGFSTQSPIVHNNIAYITSNGYIFAIDIKTGKKVWSHFDKLRSSPAVHANQVYAASSKGFNAYDAQTGKILWSHPLNNDGYGAISSPLIISFDKKTAFHSGISGNQQ